MTTQVDELMKLADDYGCVAYASPSAEAAMRSATRAALRSAIVEALGQWRPISTAPTHGHILLFWKHAGACVGYWGIDDGFDRRPKKWQCPEAGWKGEADTLIPRNQEDCTHWMPLPHPPAPPADALQQMEGER